MTRKKLLLYTLITSTLAVFVHAYLSLHYYDVILGSTNGSGLCNINSYFNCDAVSASKFSAFFGIPIALFGFYTNLILSGLLLLAYYGIVSDSDNILRYSFYLQAIIVIASLVMGTISFTLLSNACLFCITAYLLSFIGFALFIKIQSFSIVTQFYNDLLNLFGKNKSMLWAYLAIPILAAVSHEMLNDIKGVQEVEKVAQEKVESWKLAPVQKFTEEGLILTHGNGEIKATVIEFADFLCPHCKAAAEPMHKFIERQPNTRLIFKPFPLDGTCNSAIPNSGDGIRCALAYATFCSEKLNKMGWLTYDYIFKNQSDFYRIGLIQIVYEKLAKELGLDKDKLIECANSNETTDLIRRLSEEGKSAQVRGTPSIYLNNKYLEGGQLLPILERAYHSL